MTGITKRLSVAFRLMRERHLIARQNFTCCQTCGSYEIVEDAMKRIAAGRRVDGYAFFHHQDAQSLRASEDFHIAYGSVQDNCADSAVENVGKIVVDCLTLAGISTEWSGSPHQRIRVKVAA